MNYEYTYGWGGTDISDTYCRSWVALVNNNISVNGWDTIEVHPGDIVSFRHVDDIRTPWEQVQLIPFKTTSEPGEKIGFTIRKILITKYSGRAFSISGPFVLPDARVLVNEREVMNDNSILLSDFAGEFSLQFNNGGKYFVEIDHSFSESAEINVNYPLLDPVNMNIPLKIFPNPGSDRIYINGEYSDLNSVRIFSTDGKLMHCDVILNGESDLVIDINSLEKGYYILEIRSGDKVSVNKFIKY